MNKQNKLLKVIWWLYIALLFVFVVIKFKGSFHELSDRINSYAMRGLINYNLVPFRSISVQIRRISQWWALKNLLGNIIPFMPFGFLLPIAYRNFNSFTKFIGMGIVTILFIELFQLFTKLGSFDIDDIILNMLGIICGYLMLILIKRVAVKGEN